MDRDVSRHGLYPESGPGIEWQKFSATSEIIPLMRSGFGKPRRSSKKFDLKKCINIINYLHFSGSSIFAQVTSSATNEDFLLKVYPGPCRKDMVTCRLSEGSMVDLKDFELKNLIINNGKYLLFIPVISLDITSVFLTVKIQNKCYTFSERARKRILCHFVDAEIQQGDSITKGVLEDFNPNGLRIALHIVHNAGQIGLRPLEEVSVKLYKENRLVFSGRCQIIRFSDADRSIILKPLRIPYSRFKERKNRNPRISPTSFPKVIFDHPFNNKRITYEITDITTSGLSIIEDSENALLMPGMIIPSMTILYAGGLKITCSAQVVYSKSKKLRKQVRHGLSILDMNMRDYSTLFDIVSSAVDPHANMSSEISMDDLWEFFFDSGFIYPGKYEHLSIIKEQFKDTYKKLYHDGKDIFTNFTYQKNGQIIGHNCTIRAYQRSWMIHHLAARSTGARRIGLDVLKHSHYFFDGMYRLPSVKMDYMIMYFRPNNRFPCYFFGGYCKDSKDPRACSMDLFAYKTVQLSPSYERMPDGWIISKCESDDIKELREWYSTKSQGLTLDAFGLDTRTDPGEEHLEDMYRRIGLKRSCTPYVLKRNGKSHAFFIIDKSDEGINLSELLNCIKIFVLDPVLPWDILKGAVDSFKKIYEADSLTLLIYPLQHIEAQDIPYEKKYYLWVLNTQYGDEYVEYIKQKLQFQLIKFITKMIKSKVRKFD
jgi:hypothetical protein